MARVSYGELLEPYAFRSDFDYWKHLETRSHFDVLSDRIDQSIIRLGLSQAELAELTVTRIENQMLEVSDAIIAGQDRIADELRSGFLETGNKLDQVTDSVDRVRNSVDEVRFALENGFRLTERRLSSIEHVLSDLLEAVRSPERTWALEQYATARDLYRREYYRDALEYLDIAINGKGPNSGYRFDAQFHLLRGTILIGDRENLDRTLIDPRASKSAFEEAVKYAKPPRDMLDAADSARRIELLQPRCFALCCSGWASYVIGEMIEAERCYRASVGDCPDDPSANFYLGKVLAHQNRHDEAALHVAKSIRGNFYFIAQLAADADFNKESRRYLGIVETYRNELLDDLTLVCDALLNAASEKRGFALDRNGKPLDVLPDSEFTGVRGDISVEASLVQLANRVVSRTAQIGLIVRKLPEITSATLKLASTLEANEQSFVSSAENAKQSLHRLEAPTEANIQVSKNDVEKVRETHQKIGYGAGALSAAGWLFVDGAWMIPLFISIAYATLGAPLVAGMYEGNLRSENYQKARAEWERNRGDLTNKSKGAGLELDNLRSLKSKLEQAIASSSFQKYLNSSRAGSADGRVFEGVVVALHDYGVMVRFNGRDEGLVHVSQLSKRRVNHPSEMTAVGRKVRVIVLGTDDRGNIRLGMKMVAQPDVKNLA